MDVLAQLDLSDDEQGALARILDCESDDLADVLQPFATAALKEYVSMFLGQRVFTRGSDLIEYRLLLLIQHAFGGRIPEEQEVCSLFQETSSGSRSLLRAVMSKYQYLLKSAIEGTMRTLLNSAEIDGDRSSMTFAVHNMNLVDELNRQLAEINTNLPPVQKKRGSVSTYELQPSSYGSLCTELGVASKLPANE